MDLPHGGHLSHGYQLPTKKISMVSKYFDTLAYRLDPATGTIDYDQVEFLAERYRPKMIVCGASSYPREIDYERFRAIADTYGSYLMCDMAHISGLVSAGCLPSPFPHSHIVTTTTHKSLRGPRGAMIFYKKSDHFGKGKSMRQVTDLEEKVNAAVFPGLQGGPHNHTIGALATALHQASREDYKEYQRQVVRNAKAMAEALLGLGYQLISGGTDNHLILVDLKRSPCNIDGGRAERVLELANLTTNKNTVVGDRSALVPGGIRLGSPACTSRGMVETDFEQIARFVDEGVQIAVSINERCEGKKLRDFLQLLEGDNHTNFPEIAELKQRVTDFASQFPTVGY
jgi:glycine hydroxymethyltransferase